jgi:glycine/D-amino acid oxidase-like deaminating enzyme
MEDSILDNKKKVLIIGGGIFGLSTAIVLGEKGIQVTLIEKNFDVMQGASLVNQNRIHYGYHYPRSTSTAEESLHGLKTFKEFYGESIYGAFDKYYAIAKRGSHINADEFVSFCNEVGLELKESWPKEKLLNREVIDACWLTPEPIFDFHKLKQIAIYRLSKLRNVRIIRNTQAISIERVKDNSFEIKLTNGYRLHADYILNTTYSGISDFAESVKQEPIKGKFQLCVMPILEAEKSVASPFGITVMDGPFCSLMPKGFNQNQFILYHVVHSVVQQHIGHHSVNWSPIDGFVELDIMELSKNFFPILSELKLRDSWITSRIVLPDQELDDARPTLMIEHAPNIFSIFSGKLTTCVDAAINVLKRIESDK